MEHGKRTLSRCEPWLLILCLGWECSLAAQTREEQAVAAVLMGEAWSEGVQGMTAVAEVIHQRALEKGRTPLQIVSARRGRIHAFSCLNHTTLERLIAKFSDEPDFQDALRLAQLVCQAPDRLPGITNAANHYTVARERPIWTRGQTPVAVVGRHAFYHLDQY